MFHFHLYLPVLLFFCCQISHQAKNANLPLEMENLRRALVKFLNKENISIDIANQCDLGNLPILQQLRHTAVKESFFQKNMTLAEVDFFMRPKFVMLPGAFIDRWRVNLVHIFGV